MIPHRAGSARKHLVFLIQDYKGPILSQVMKDKRKLPAANKLLYPLKPNMFALSSQDASILIKAKHPVWGGH